MKKIKDISLTSWTLFLIGLVSILPFILLSFYTVPNLEDYAESIIPDVWWHVKFLYLTYDGRYFVSFLFAALNPLKGGHYILYQCIPPILLISLFAALYHLIRTFITNLNKEKYFLLSLIIFALFLNRNPNISYSYYYMISSYVYLVPLILYLLFICVSYKLILNTHLSLPRLCLSLMLVFAISGGNELLLVPVLAWFGILVFMNSKLETKKNKELALLFLAICCAFFIVFSSPGIHQYFEESMVQKDWQYVLNTISNSISFSLWHLKQTLRNNYSLLVGSILVLAVLMNAPKRPALRMGKTKIAFVGISLFIAYLFLIFPYCWAAAEKASPYYSQTFIIPYHFLILSWFLFLFILSQNILPSKSAPRFSKPSISLFLSTILLFSLVLDPYSRIHIAYKELLNGEAKAYANEIRSNIDRSIHAEKYLDQAGVLSLCELKHQPSSLSSGVYFTSGREAFHLEYRLFYNIEKIEVKQCP